jgi:hypothetical protein
VCLAAFLPLFRFFPLYVLVCSLSVLSNPPLTCLSICSATQLVASGSSFLPLLKASISTTIEKKLVQLGVKYHFNTSVSTDGIVSGPISKRTFDLGGGKSVEGALSVFPPSSFLALLPPIIQPLTFAFCPTADYVYIAYGFKPRSDFANPALLNEKKLFKVRPSLQLESNDRAFAVGDVNDVDVRFSVQVPSPYLF